MQQNCGAAYFSTDKAGCAVPTDLFAMAKALQKIKPLVFGNGGNARSLLAIQNRNK